MSTLCEQLVVLLGAPGADLRTGSRAAGAACLIELLLARRLRIVRGRGRFGRPTGRHLAVQDATRTGDPIADGFVAAVAAAERRLGVPGAVVLQGTAVWDGWLERLRERGVLVVGPHRGKALVGSHELYRLAAPELAEPVRARMRLALVENAPGDLETLLLACLVHRARLSRLVVGRGDLPAATHNGANLSEELAWMIAAENGGVPGYRGGGTYFAGDLEAGAGLEGFDLGGLDLGGLDFGAVVDVFGSADVSPAGDGGGGADGGGGGDGGGP